VGSERILRMSQEAFTQIGGWGWGGLKAMVQWVPNF
jgi:hypothetical protein